MGIFQFKQAALLIMENTMAGYHKQSSRNQHMTPAVTSADLCKISYLGNIADIIALIDSDKNYGGSNILNLSNRGIKLIQEMKNIMIETGKLKELITAIQDVKNKPELLYKAIDSIHCEIERLLGDKAWHIYWPN